MDENFNAVYNRQIGNIEREIENLSETIGNLYSASLTETLKIDTIAYLSAHKRNLELELKELLLNHPSLYSDSDTDEN